MNFIKVFENISVKLIIKIGFGKNKNERRPSETRM